jgi:hypothetical protein
VSVCALRVVDIVSRLVRPLYSHFGNSCPRRIENCDKSEKSKDREITLHSFTLKLNIAPYYDKMHDSDGFAAQSQEEYDDHAGEGPIDIDGCNGNLYPAPPTLEKFTTPVSPSPATIRQIDPSTPSGNIGMVNAVVAWCHRHNLGDEESQCLRKLGFRFGNDLDELTDEINEMWKFAEALPLCCMRILQAYRSSKDVSGPKFTLLPKLGNSHDALFKITFFRNTWPFRSRPVYPHLITNYLQSYHMLNIVRSHSATWFNSNNHFVHVIWGR